MSLDHFAEHSGLLSAAKLKNIKGVRQADIKFRRLNVLIGANNVGKSTILQSILLLAQSFREPQRVDFPRLPLSGCYVNLGTPRDFLSAFTGKDESSSIQLEFGDDWLYVELMPSKVEYDPAVTVRMFSVYEAPAEHFAEWERVIGEIVVADSIREKKINLLFKIRVVTDRRNGPGLEVEFKEIKRIQSRLSLQFIQEGNSIALDESSSEPSVTTGITGNPFEGDFSTLCSVPLAGVVRQIVENTPESVLTYEVLLVCVADLLRGLPSDTRNSRDLNWVFSEAMEAARGKNESTVSVERVQASLRMLEGQSEVHQIDERVEIDRLAEHLRRVRYLGPLRFAPSGEAAQGRSPEDVGSRGESTLSYLSAHSDDMTECPLSFKDTEREGTHSKQMQLRDAVNYWMTQFGLSEQITVRTGERGIPTLVVRRPGVDRDIDWSSLGMGAIQLLPCLVLTLSAVPNSELILIEQPELHLHPTLEARLGDFFIQCARTGRQILIETHSEHLVERFRRRIAESPVSQEDQGLEELVSLVFAEANDDSSTSYREVHFNEFGGLRDEWPAGFMSVSNEDMLATIEAAAHKAARLQES
jgi:predicted ATPase